MSFFTPEDLLRYLYNELPTQKREAIEKALAEDWTLREKLEVLETSRNELHMPLQSPREEVILSVLNYARETMPATTL